MITSSYQLVWHHVDDTPPPAPGLYLVTVATDDGRIVAHLEWNGKNWIYEGEPTYCQVCWFNPMYWAVPPEPCDGAPEDDGS